MKVIVKCVVILTLLAIVPGGLFQRLQRIRFFQGNNCNPSTPFRDFTLSANVSLELPQASQAYCVMSGAWRVQYALFMNENDYNISMGDYCEACHRGLRRYGYIRYITGQDLTQPSVSLYTERGFAGNETQVNINNGLEFTFDSPRSFSSFALSSYHNWTWRMYSLPHFRGNSVCRSANSGNEVTLFDNTAITVGSLRLGCRNSSPPRYKDVGILFTIIFALGIPSITVFL